LLNLVILFIQFPNLGKQLSLFLLILLLQECYVFVLMKRI